MDISIILKFRIESREQRTMALLAQGASLHAHLFCTLCSHKIEINGNPNINCCNQCKFLFHCFCLFSLHTILLSLHFTNTPIILANTYLYISIYIYFHRHILSTYAQVKLPVIPTPQSNPYLVMSAKTNFYTRPMQRLSFVKPVIHGRERARTGEQIQIQIQIQIPAIIMIMIVMMIMKMTLIIKTHQMKMP
jgi:hypothetical protein